MDTTESPSTRLYLTLDGAIHAVAPMDQEIDDAIADTIRQIAATFVTAYWIEGAIADGYVDNSLGYLGSLPRVSRSITSPDNKFPTRKVVDFHLYTSPLPAKTFDQIDRSDSRSRFFQVQIVNAEAEYHVALAEFQQSIERTSITSENDIISLQRLRDQVATASDRMLKSQPSVDVDSAARIDAILAETPWRDVSGKMISRLSEIEIGAVTKSFLWESRRFVRFLYRTDRNQEWSNAYALVNHLDQNETIEFGHHSWLHERKIQLGLNNAQIDLMHRIVEGYLQSMTEDQA